MIVDCHAHLVAPNDLYAYKSSLIASGIAAGRRAPRISDEALAVSTANNVAIMDSVGTDIQFISPRPFQMMHAMKPDEIVVTWNLAVNDIIHRVTLQEPTRFRGMGSLPQFHGSTPKDWLGELERCVNELGFVGVLINPDPSEGASGTPAMGDEWWYPLYEKMCELDVPGLIHSSGCCNGRENYSEHFITEESISTLSLLRSRTLLDFPDLKLIVGHGGGSVPYQVGRWQAERLLGGRSEKDHIMGEHFIDSLRRLKFDTCLHHKDSLELLFKLCLPENCLFGTEKPGSGSAKNPENDRYFDDLKSTIEEIEFLSAQEKQNILGDNAKALFSRFDA